MTGHTLMLLEGLTVKECETACKHKQACKSINTKPLECKLVSKSTENPFDHVELTAEAEWTYRTIDYKEINVSIRILSEEKASVEDVSAKILQRTNFKQISNFPLVLILQD